MNIYLTKVLKNEISYPEFLVSLSKALVCPAFKQKDTLEIKQIINVVEKLIRLLVLDSTSEHKNDIKKEFVMLIKLLKNINPNFEKCIKKVEAQDILLRNKYFIQPFLYEKIKENLKKEELFFKKEYEKLIGEEI